MFTSVTDQPAAEYMNVEAAVGHLLIVRPQRYQDSGFITEFQPQGTDVVFCDVCDLDLIDPATNQPGKVFRGNSFLQGYLKGTFKRYLGHTLIGMIYTGPRQRGQKPPYMWQDLSADPNIVARGQAWMAAHQDFLVAITPAVAEVAPAAYQHQTPQAPQVGPYAQPDPHATPAAAPVSAPAAPPAYTQPAPTVHQPMTTLQQLRAANQNHQGQPQSETPPF